MELLYMIPLGALVGAFLGAQLGGLTGLLVAPAVRRLRGSDASNHSDERGIVVGAVLGAAAAVVWALAVTLG